MRRRKIYIALAILLGLLVGIAVSPAGRNIKFFVGKQVAWGSVTKDQALSTKCGEKNVTCDIVDGKVKAKAISQEDQEKIKKEFPSEQAMHVEYADNVLEAVQAIREYTGVGNLDLYRLNDTTPTNVSYYCTKENKCWAVDNKTHQVIPQLR